MRRRAVRQTRSPLPIRPGIARRQLEARNLLCQGRFNSKGHAMRDLIFIVTGLSLVLVACQPKDVPKATETPTPAETAGPAAPVEPPHHKVTLAPTQGNQAAGTLELISHGDSVAIAGTISGLPLGSTDCAPGRTNSAVPT